MARPGYPELHVVLSAMLSHGCVNQSDWEYGNPGDETGPGGNTSTETSTSSGSQVCQVDWTIECLDGHYLWRYDAGGCFHSVTPVTECEFGCIVGESECVDGADDCVPLWDTYCIGNDVWKSDLACGEPNEFLTSCMFTCIDGECVGDTDTGTDADGDIDNDGFSSDVDCDDLDPFIYPLELGVENIIDSSVTICAGEYPNTSVTFTGNEIHVDVVGPYSFSTVMLPGGYIVIDSLSNSNVERFFVSETEGYGTGPLYWKSAIHISESHDNVFYQLFGMCSDVYPDCYFGIRVDSSDRNVMLGASGSGSLIGIFLTYSNDNTLQNCSGSGSQGNIVVQNGQGNSLINCND